MPKGKGGGFLPLQGEVRRGLNAPDSGTPPPGLPRSGGGKNYAPCASACFFARAATIPTIDISPMDLPMESSRPKT